MKTKKKWFVTISLMRGNGEQHMYIKMDIEHAHKLFRFISENYYNCLEKPVYDPLMDWIIERLNEMVETYEQLEREEET